MKKNNVLTIILIVVISSLIVGITWLIVNILNGKIDLNNLRFFNSTSKELIVNESYKYDFSKIDIYSQAGDVYIKESSSEEVKVLIYGDKERTMVTAFNNELIISVKSKPCIGICLNKNSKVEVYLPKDYENKIIINSEYGDIRVGSFEKATLEINEECGDVSVLSADSVNINNEYGDINVGTVKEATINVSSGDIEIDSVYNVKLNNDYGDIEINKVLNYLDVSNDCGDIEIDNIALNKDSKISANLGNIEIGNTNNIYIDAKTDLGKVKIKNNYRNSNIVLTIENDCGDIIIDN